MSSVVIFLLIFFFWSGVLYYQIRSVNKKVGLTTARAIIFYSLLNTYPLSTKIDFKDNWSFIRMALTIKFGQLLLFSFLIKVVLFITIWETILLIIILIVIGFALYYLAFLEDRNKKEYQCVYPLSNEVGVYEIALLPSAPSAKWIGVTLAELDLRKKELLVLSIFRSGRLTIFPKGPEILLAGDRLLVFGKNTTLPSINI